MKAEKVQVPWYSVIIRFFVRKSDPRLQQVSFTFLRDHKKISSCTGVSQCVNSTLLRIPFTIAIHSSYIRHSCPVNMKHSVNVKAITRRLKHKMTNLTTPACKFTRDQSPPLDQATSLYPISLIWSPPLRV